jgi:hypothetical protein
MAQRIYNATLVDGVTNDNSTYSTGHDAGSGNNKFPYARNIVTGGQYYFGRTGFVFDTTDLSLYVGNYSQIGTVTLKATVGTIIGATGTVCIVTFAPSSTGSFVLADYSYNKWGVTILGSTSGATWTSGNNHDFILNDKTVINISGGKTVLGARASEDVGYITPAGWDEDFQNFSSVQLVVDYNPAGHILSTNSKYW